jgi:hypothetical protein
MKQHILVCFLIAFMAASAGRAPGQPAQTIYDDTSMTADEAFTALQIGDEVYAADNAREISQLQVGLTMQGASGTSDFVLRLYDNTGSGGAPGSLLWQSAEFNNVPLSGGNELISFNVPDVLVPDVFTWTLQITNYTPVAVGLVGAGDPTIGGSPAYTWFGGPGKWTQLSDPQNFAVSIQAVPEPGEVSLLGFALGILALRYRPHKTGYDEPV